MSSMRKALVIAAFFLAFGGKAFSQPHIFVPPKAVKDTSTFWIFKDITLGPYFSAGYSRQNEKLPDEWHSSPRFAWQFGGTMDFTINPWFGFVFSALYDSRDMYLATSSEDTSIDMNLGYVAIEPSIRIFWLLIGLTFDVAMSGSADEAVAQLKNPWTGVTAPYSANLSAETRDLATLVELRGTVSLPILESESGILHLIVSGSYPLGHSVTGVGSFDTTATHVFSGIGRGPLPTVEAGLTYQFDILH